MEGSFPKEAPVHVTPRKGELLPVLSWNIAGLGSKPDGPEWRNFIGQFEILSLQEKWSTSSAIFLLGYQSFFVQAQVSAHGRPRRGLLVLVALSLGCLAEMINHNSDYVKAIILTFAHN